MIDPQRFSRQKEEMGGSFAEQLAHSLSSGAYAWLSYSCRMRNQISLTRIAVAQMRDLLHV